MGILISKKAITITIVAAAMIVAQAYAQKAQRDHDDKPENLKVLPKDISEQDLHNAMRNYSKALGVRCNYCHEAHPVEGSDRPRMDFASDKVKEKEITRDMIKMTAELNDRIGKIGDGKLKQVTCVTCHNGSTHPNNSIEELKKN